MYKTFDEHPNRGFRALQVWQILIAKASNRQVTTYGELEKIVGFKGAGVFSQILGHIMYFCQQHDLPPLTAIVVKKETGRPGSGMTASNNLDADRENVFNFKWFRLVPPSPIDLNNAFRKGHQNQTLPKAP